MNSRYRERKYNTSENDRLLRALSQPVQAWDKKWSQNSSSKNLQTFKWVKSDRIIEYEEEESDEEPEPMETEQEGSNDQSRNDQINVIEKTTTTQTTADGLTTTTTVEITNTTNAVSKEEIASKTTIETSDIGNPGGQSTMLINKSLSSVQQEEEEDDTRSMTPKLDDISDVDNADNEDEDNDVDSINDPSKHPALAPHAQARMTDDDMTDSTAATPQTTTEENTPMPMLEDEPIHGQQPHPLSQEILSGATQFISNNDDNDSPAIQTPEDRQSDDMEQ